MSKLFKSNKKKDLGKRRFIALLSLALGSVLALSSATIAWFGMASNEGASIATFSGSLDVSIRKISAYKYVYPYHNNSVEFIDYEGTGHVKSYVVEDASIEAPNNLANKVSFSLGRNTGQHYVTSSSDSNKGPAKIHYENSRTFNYYLVGNSTFTGIDTDEWSTLSASAFARKDAPVVGADGSVKLENVVVSVGAEFILFDATSIVDDECDYFTYNSPTTTPSGNARFTVVDSNRLKCLKSGIYTIEYRVDSSSNYYLDITLTSRNDNAIIGTNLIDPTKITIDYRGSASASYGSINDYLPHAIQDQKTMVVLDVELAYQNKNDIDASLTITRDGQNARSIYGFDGKYATTNEYTYRGYVDSSHRNPLNASDFYAFYVAIAKDANAYATPTAAWNAFSDYCQTDYEIVGGKKYAVPQENPYNKFHNDALEGFDTSLECDVHSKELDDSTLIPGSATNNLYHIYIAIDYDYERMQFFTNQDRVGKTYLLDRDFQFYFGAAEHLEEVTPDPAPLPHVGGEKDQYEKG